MASKNKSNIIRVTVVQEGRFLVATGDDGVNYSNKVERPLRRQAAEQGLVLLFDKTKNLWSIEGGEEGVATAAPEHMVEDQPTELVLVEPGEDHETIRKFIHNSVALRPKDLIMSDLKWKYLVRNAMRGKNICLTGDSGGGKTKAAQALVKTLNRPNFYFNLGATQDPRATLIGNTQFNQTDGTYFSESLFVQAIQTKNAVILLDEISRAHPEAWNILMTVLDPIQKYLRLDEKEGTPTISVAEGVSFIATANIGTNYTATRVMDRALIDRFLFIEVDELDVDDEFRLLKMIYPKAQYKLLQNLAEIACATRTEMRQANSKLSSKISTRVNIEAAGLVYDGFTIAEIAEVAIYPFFDEAGGVDSERTFIKQIVQKYVENPNDKSKDDLFGEGDIAKKDLPF